MTVRNRLCNGSLFFCTITMYKILGKNTETQRHEAASADTKNTKGIYKITPL
jgi:hypothetical protein